MSYILKDLTQAECFAVLEQSRFGHLACCKDGKPYVVPIYFAYAKGVIYSFSMPGRKVDWMRTNENVCLQIEQHGSGKGWTSVVVDGRFEEFPDTDLWHNERLQAWSLLQKHFDWWEIGALKPQAQSTASASEHIFYGIFVREVTGRTALPVD
ncbi:pyridoxamine 5'-phosphate oxidase family protein [Rhizobium leguminosarum]|uniref:Pyridoxamine 5'-phosphate oxidase family protein n=1 Tax=Rhizobium leguminosarum TaxID=384 RepID=A0A2Z4YRL6_RHILE|nr:pyridoxamine 5'-phosphate oxidase family protein [Rhizobium leguminosarum]AXA42965.1 Pyridoxamine 5'-phosphate oxidase family protein [Rhizobium leguminosarum]